MKISVIWLFLSLFKLYIRSMNFLTRFTFAKFFLIVPVLLAFSASVPSMHRFEMKQENVSPKPDIKATAWAKSELAKLTLREKIGQFFMVAAYPNKAASVNETIELIETEKVGGVIVFQGTMPELDSAVKQFNVASKKTPLFIGMDAEWGMEMRVSEIERFPYAYTMGAANDLKLSEQIGEMMAQECREHGIHMNFSPVADVNSNPDNPVIGFRSFGENPREVALQVSAFVKAFEKNGVMSCLKHFPGHGNTTTDSHYELPLIDRSKIQIDAIDWYPFREGIAAGASSVMMGHLNVPALDNSGLPASLSRKIIKDNLQEELGFEGLVISDALNMKGISNNNKTDVVVQAFMAGCDILLFPESVKGAIDEMEKMVTSGKITAEEIDRRCLKLLEYKYKFVVAPAKFKPYTVDERRRATEAVYDKAANLLKNEDSLMPFAKLSGKTALVCIGGLNEGFIAGIQRFDNPDVIIAKDGDEARRKLAENDVEYARIITSVHAASVRSAKEFSAPELFPAYARSLPATAHKILIVFGNPHMLDEIGNDSYFQSVIAAYENHPLMQERISQMIYGALPMQGRLPFRVSQVFPRESGIDTKTNGRLRFAHPSDFGVSLQKLSEIDAVALSGIKEGAYPGCQIVVAFKGAIIYQKSFGYQTYKPEMPILNSDIYDIASITKIAASTLSLMKLESEGKFSADKYLDDYIPEITANTPYGKLKLKDMLTHQAGLKSWIPFYTKTLESGKINPEIYAKTFSPEFPYEVAPGMFMRADYADTMYARILNTSLGTKKYLYSDLGYYFVKKIVEKLSATDFESYIETIYSDMGLRSIAYNPIKQFDISRITPTENDKIFRQQLIHGYVHDQGAAMLGGVGGHAGLFSNATDLASLMQLFLNKGYYGGAQYLQADVVDKYTSCAYCPGNRRGIGFDKPVTSLKGGPTSSLVSLKSFGHTGFTGTMAWADPVHDINYVFLSNRVYPDAENWKIVNSGIRTNIQQIIYEALKGK